MKILQINKFYFLKGGSERYLFGLTKILEKEGHTVIPFSMQGSNNFPSAYAEYFIEPVSLDKFSIKNIIKFFYNRDAVKRLERLIRNEKPDIAHLHNIAHQLSPAIIPILKKYGIPIVQTLHDYKPICPNAKLFAHGRICERCKDGRYYHCLFQKCMKDSFFKSLLGTIEAYYWNNIRKIYGQIDLFIAPSEYMKEQCIAFGIPKEKIQVVRNFLDSPEDAPLVKRKTEDCLLYFGRLEKEKGIEVLLNAMLSVKKGRKLKIVGSGSEYKRLENKIIGLGLEGRVELLGPKFGTDLAGIIESSILVVLPSIWPENMPYVLLESLSAGKAVAVSRIGGMDELITDKINGFSFPTGNAEALASIINDLDHYDLLEIGNRAKETVQGLDADWHYREIIKIYSELKKK